MPVVILLASISPMTSEVLLKATNKYTEVYSVQSVKENVCYLNLDKYPQLVEDGEIK
jgi:hypothetical protein